MPIRLYIDNDYTDNIITNILNRQKRTLIISSTKDKITKLANKTYEHIEKVFNKEYKKIEKELDISLYTPISVLYFIVPCNTNKIKGATVSNIIVDDFTNIPSDFLHDIVYGYTAIQNKVNIDFYTNDIKNMKIYSWINDYSN